jgi:4-amino-4-deoxy-L-arabinose transferase-like glycosyltransferase
MTKRLLKAFALFSIAVVLCAPQPHLIALQVLLIAVAAGLIVLAMYALLGKI